MQDGDRREGSKILTVKQTSYVDSPREKKGRKWRWGRPIAGWMDADGVGQGHVDAAQMPSEENGECNAAAAAAAAPLVVISRNDWARKWDWAVNGGDQTSPSCSIYPARLSELSRSVLGNGKKFY